MTNLSDFLRTLTEKSRQSLAKRARSMLGISDADGSILPENSQRKYVWQRLSPPGIADYAAGRYGSDPRNDAVHLMLFEPKFALDVGCSSGGVARTLKDTFPKCRFWGIDPDAKAADLARSYMEKVIVSSFENIDWAAQGVNIGDIDTVFLLDVLEHMYDPWSVLSKLRTLVSPQSQIVISLPNVRNMSNIRDLMNGYWRYRDDGLLDATHIRFFTQHEALRLIYQTGFRVERHSFTWCPDMASTYDELKDRPFPQRLEFERGSLVIESLTELISLSAVQLMFLVRPAHRDELSTEELALVDEPHPKTFAMGADYAGTL